ncbi:Uncharacterised protein [Kytococcus sedentarius]|nr:Uncharacterised protein [Kytococcus sedentarius]
MGRMTPTAPTDLQRRCWAVLAGVALTGALASMGLATLGLYPETRDQPSALGGHPAGWAGVLPRAVDALAYFTHWSNLVVAVTAWRVARGGRPAAWERVLVLDALLMISITALVYAVVLAPTAQVTGWEHVTNPWVHVVTPVATVLLWLALGPRGWLTWWAVPAALLLPLTWVVLTLARGAVVDQYPYGFVDVVQLGLGRVLVNVAAIVGLGVVVAALYRLVDGLLEPGRSHDRAPDPGDPDRGFW